MMIRSIRLATRTACLFAIPFALTATTAVAQEEAAEEAAVAQEEAAASQCTFEVSPLAIEPGLATVEVSIQLSENIGEITGIETPEDSGIRLVTPEDLEMVGMAAEGEEEAVQPEPIVLSEDKQIVTLLLNTSEAMAGVYAVSIQGETDNCAGWITVADAEEGMQDESMQDEGMEESEGY